ncbi:alpha-1,2-fucosyltransferase [Flavobacterium sp. ZT3R17]|uniref:alpha-1,2-fucosyltransferase n=1 Tax=Flavobacterium cryoconiti TaxID=3398736 RepID=UPI003A84FF23
MDVVVIFNGIGNQMSQYAFYLQKKKINSSTYLISSCHEHNGLEIDSVFDIAWNERFIDKALNILFRLLMTRRLRIITSPLKYLLKLTGTKVIEENFNYNFNPEYLKPTKGITFYIGGWHNEKYFVNIKNDVLKSFSFSKEIDKVSLAIAKEMSEKESVAIHVRRGDYLNEANINLFGKVCTKSYFEKAINIMNDQIKLPHYYVFSNDIAWVKENLNLERVTYITHNSGENSWRDIFLMTNCKYNIVANSSFSWWGAWLNKNQFNKVVSPAKFLNSDKISDIYPSHWIKIYDN